jgi:hypothetical protein
MRQIFHHTLIVLFTLFIAACSGGNKLTDTDTDTGGGTTTSASTLVLSMVDSSGAAVTNVDGSKPEWLSAIYKTDGKAVVNKKVTFSLDGDVGQLLITTALTNSDGIAAVEIHAGSIVGAGTATVTIDSLTDTVDFSTSNPVAVIAPVNLTITLVNELGESVKNVSSIEPARLQATLTNSGLASAGVKVTFLLVDAIGELKTTSALTDDKGVALILLYAGAQDGAGTVTASVGDVTASLDFSTSVTVANVVMGDLILLPTSIGPNGTASLSVPINEVIAGTTSPLTQSINVQFSSACVQAGKAEIANEVATVNGIATVTYKDKGCGTVDKINVTSTIGQTVLTKNVDLTVGAAALHSIQFTDVSSSFLALKGTGGLNRSETATVTFTVFDKLSKPVANALVNFRLTTSVGGIGILPESQAETDAEGKVDVIVSSGTVAIPVRVVASLDANDDISTISGQLSISTGVADFNSFSLSATTLNPDTFHTDGVEVGITARLADHFNNPVPDGTTVQFSTEFGAIVSNCLTVDGACSVQWRSQSPRVPDPEFRDSAITFAKLIGNSSAPCLDSNDNVTGLSAAGLPCFYDNKKEGNQHGGLGNVYGNRISIFAHVLGEESFSDSNGSGTFTVGEAFTDLTEAFRDDNEDNVFGALLGDGSPVAGAADSTSDNNKCYHDNTIACFETGGDNEEYIDLNSDNIFDKGNGLYNGVLCPQADHDTGACSRELVSISRNITILQADGDNNRFKVGAIQAGLDPRNPVNYWQSVNISADDRTIFVYVADQFNGLLPAGTIISFEAGNGSIVGPSECAVSNSSSFGTSGCSVSLTKDDETSSGSLSITVAAPDRTGVTYSIGVID